MAMFWTQFVYTSIVSFGCWNTVFPWPYCAQDVLCLLNFFLDNLYEMNSVNVITKGIVNSLEVKHQFWNFETEYWILFLKHERVWKFRCYHDGIVWIMKNNNHWSPFHYTILRTLHSPHYPTYTFYTPSIITHF